MASTTTFTQLPLAIVLGGGEIVPIDVQNADGTYSTKRTTAAALGSFYSLLGLLKSQVIAATQAEFLTIVGASMDQFIATQVGDNTTSTYVAYWHHPFAPIGGKLYTMISTYLTAVVGLSSLQASAHLTNIWTAAPSINAG